MYILNLRKLTEYYSSGDSEKDKNYSRATYLPFTYSKFDLYDYNYSKYSILHKYLLFESSIVSFSILIF